MIKLHRKVQENPVFKNGRLFKYYVALLFEADNGGACYRGTLDAFESQAISMLAGYDLISVEACDTGIAVHIAGWDEIKG